ncbi:hypothetical protein GDO86_003490 [Hymenochirus boettgeri]|uniref:Beta/gamma crystallin 'Greek key' domain-containing protein n=1 Tax=Hymenochirus boettgeri TaxID=247094 RepID=A0A8T2K6K3_9PIPI|nr:hypothetical protein GDO86_003490 [Hymenochirus boettgeri]
MSSDHQTDPNVGSPPMKNKGLRKRLGKLFSKSEGNLKEKDNTAKNGEHSLEEGITEPSEEEKHLDKKGRSSWSEKRGKRDRNGIQNDKQGWGHSLPHLRYHRSEDSIWRKSPRSSKTKSLSSSEMHLPKFGFLRQFGSLTWSKKRSSVLEASHLVSHESTLVDTHGSMGQFDTPANSMRDVEDGRPKSCNIESLFTYPTLKSSDICSNDDEGFKGRLDVSTSFISLSDCALINSFKEGVTEKNNDQLQFSSNKRQEEEEVLPYWAQNILNEYLPPCHKPLSSPVLKMMTEGEEEEYSLPISSELISIAFEDKQMTHTDSPAHYNREGSNSSSKSEEIKGTALAKGTCDTNYISQNEEHETQKINPLCSFSLEKEMVENVTEDKKISPANVNNHIKTERIPKVRYEVIITMIKEDEAKNQVNVPVQGGIQMRGMELVGPDLDLSPVMECQACVHHGEDPVALTAQSHPDQTKYYTSQQEKSPQQKQGGDTSKGAHLDRVHVLAKEEETLLVCYQAQSSIMEQCSLTKERGHSTWRAQSPRMVEIITHYQVSSVPTYSESIPAHIRTVSPKPYVGNVNDLRKVFESKSSKEDFRLSLESEQFKPCSFLSEKTCTGPKNQSVGPETHGPLYSQVFSPYKPFLEIKGHNDHNYLLGKKNSAIEQKIEDIKEKSFENRTITDKEIRKLPDKEVKVEESKDGHTIPALPNCHAPSGTSLSPSEESRAVFSLGSPKGWKNGHPKTQYPKPTSALQAENTWENSPPMLTSTPDMFTLTSKNKDCISCFADLKSSKNGLGENRIHLNSAKEINRNSLIANSQVMSPEKSEIKQDDFDLNNDKNNNSLSIGSMRSEKDYVFPFLKKETNELNELPFVSTEQECRENTINYSPVSKRHLKEGKKNDMEYEKIVTVRLVEQIKTISRRQTQFDEDPSSIIKLKKIYCTDKQTIAEESKTSKLGISEDSFEGNLSSKDVVNGGMCQGDDIVDKAESQIINASRKYELKENTGKDETGLFAFDIDPESIDYKSRDISDQADMNIISLVSAENDRSHSRPKEQAENVATRQSVVVTDYQIRHLNEDPVVINEKPIEGISSLVVGYEIEKGAKETGVLNQSFDVTDTLPRRGDPTENACNIENFKQQSENVLVNESTMKRLVKSADSQGNKSNETNGIIEVEIDNVSSREIMNNLKDVDQELGSKELEYTFSPTNSDLIQMSVNLVEMKEHFPQKTDALSLFGNVLEMEPTKGEWEENDSGLDENMMDQVVLISRTPEDSSGYSVRHLSTGILQKAVDPLNLFDKSVINIPSPQEQNVSTFIENSKDNQHNQAQNDTILGSTEEASEKCTNIEPNCQDTQEVENAITQDHETNTVSSESIEDMDSWISKLRELETPEIMKYQRVPRQPRQSALSIYASLPPINEDPSSPKSDHNDITGHMQQECNTLEVKQVPKSIPNLEQSENKYSLKRTPTSTSSPMEMMRKHSGDEDAKAGSYKSVISQSFSQRQGIGSLLLADRQDRNIEQIRGKSYSRLDNSLILSSYMKPKHESFNKMGEAIQTSSELVQATSEINNCFRNSESLHPQTSGICTPPKPANTLGSVSKELLFKINEKTVSSFDIWHHPEKDHGKINPRPGKIVLFSDPGFIGQRYEIYGNVGDTSELEFKETISIRVIRGGWILYEKPMFRGRRAMLLEGDTEMTCPWLQQKDPNTKTQESKMNNLFWVGSLRHVVRDFQVPKISLFLEKNGEGERVKIVGAAPDMSEYGGVIKTESIIVHSGMWLVFSRPSFEGDPYILEPGGYPSRNSWGAEDPQVCSLVPARIGGPTVEKPNEPKLLVFQLPGFEGNSWEVTRDLHSAQGEPNVHGERLTSVGSLRVLGGCWVGYEKEGFRGQQYLLEEGEYNDFSVWGGCTKELGSVRLIRTDFLQPEIVLYELPGCLDGPCLRLSDALSDVEVAQYGTSTGSIHVLSGVWVAYENVDFSGKQYILEKGTYNNFQDWGAENCKISSVQPVLQVGGQKLHFEGKIHLFSEPNFYGNTMTCKEDHMQIPESFSLQSCRVECGSWSLYDGEECTGEQYILSEGEYPTRTAMGCLTHCPLRSLKMVPLNFSIPSISLHGLERFEGKELEFSGEVRSLQAEGYNNHVMSVSVKRGIWVLYEHSDFRGRQWLLERKQIPNWLLYSGLQRIGSLCPIRQRRTYFRLRNRALGLFLCVSELTEDKKAARVLVTEPHDGCCFLWYYEEGRIKNQVAGDMSLQVIGQPCPGTKVVLWSEGRKPNQIWTLEDSGSILHCIFKGLCLDIKGGNSYDSDHVVIWDIAEDRLTQCWDLEVV